MLGNHGIVGRSPSSHFRIWRIKIVLLSFWDHTSGSTPACDSNVELLIVLVVSFLVPRMVHSKHSSKNGGPTKIVNG